jgi:hypothetical protein
LWRLLLLRILDGVVLDLLVLLWVRVLCWVVAWVLLLLWLLLHGALVTAIHHCHVMRVRVVCCVATAMHLPAVHLLLLLLLLVVVVCRHTSHAPLIINLITIPGCLTALRLLLLLRVRQRLRLLATELVRRQQAMSIGCEVGVAGRPLHHRAGPRGRRDRRRRRSRRRRQPAPHTLPRAVECGVDAQSHVLQRRLSTLLAKRTDASQRQPRCRRGVASHGRPHAHIPALQSAQARKAAAGAECAPVKLSIVYS